MEILALAVVVVLAAILAGVVWSYGKGSPIKNRASQSSRARALRESIPRLREIASRCPKEKVGQQAQVFLFEWHGIQSEIKRMGRDKREQRLATLYYARVQPILEAYENLPQRKRSA